MGGPLLLGCEPVQRLTISDHHQRRQIGIVGNAGLDQNQSLLIEMLDHMKQLLMTIGTWIAEGFIPVPA